MHSSRTPATVLLAETEAHEMRCPKGILLSQNGRPCTRSPWPDAQVSGKRFVDRSAGRTQMDPKRKRPYEWVQPGRPAGSISASRTSYSHGQMPSVTEPNYQPAGAPGRKCLFCGRGGKMSSEHLWPKWAQEAIASTQRARASATRCTTGRVRPTNRGTSQPSKQPSSRCARSATAAG